MRCLDTIKEALLTVSDNVGHYEALKKTPPYIVWAEDGAGDTVFANDRLQNQAITGTVDLFTRDRDGDPLMEAIPQALDGVCAWRLNSIQYEDDTKLLHAEWAWEVPNGETEQSQGG